MLNDTYLNVRQSLRVPFAKVAPSPFEISLSLLGVRAAVKWAHENIGRFGGDADNIMLWRQSQGAILSHLYILAFPETPLAAKFGVIPLGASATLDLETAGDVYQDFNIVA
ncbi:alpha/beta-hydrolase [Penicillium soppii]|uniref:alpha/beta-hydrolase n=1 Tax=Penicillium soppii TaxID=69789 RepID=UPI0025483C99|nr:alpha/beta-hydrolase [Penicillium soppii]KAJ5881650.1 alpha/beta-hydrolase [Penicillium soppii]